MKLTKIVENVVLSLFLLCILCRLLNLFGCIQLGDDIQSSAIDSTESRPLITFVQLVTLSIGTLSAIFHSLFSLQWTVATLTFLWIYEVVIHTSQTSLLYSAEIDVQFEVYIQLAIIVVGNLLGIIYTLEKQVEYLPVRCEGCLSHLTSPTTPMSRMRSELPLEPANLSRINVFNTDNILTTTMQCNATNSRKYSASICSDYVKAEDRDEFYPKHSISNSHFDF